MNGYKKFNNSLHRLGLVTSVLTLILLVSVPFIVAMINGVSIDWKGFVAGIATVGLIYYPVSIVEFLVYAPLLGTGGSYLSFITGNVTNMKIPCVMNSQDIAKTVPGTPEHEIISTMSVAVSAITTTLVVVIGVILLVPLQPILQTPALAPAFDNVVPALFGALGIKYFIKSPRIAFIPLVLMCALCIFVPSLISSTSVLMIPSGALALAIGFVLFKKGKI